MGEYPIHFLVISPSLVYGCILSPQMDTGDPGFSDFMDNIMFRPDGTGEELLLFQLHIYVCMYVCMYVYQNTSAYY